MAMTLNDFAFICTSPTTTLAFGWQHLNKQFHHYPSLLYAHTLPEPKLGLQWIHYSKERAVAKVAGFSQAPLCWAAMIFKQILLLWHEMHMAHKSEMQMASTSFNEDMKIHLRKSSVPFPDQERMECWRNKLILYFRKKWPNTFKENNNCFAWRYQQEKPT